MFIGHFGLAFAAKPLAPRASLGWLFLAAQFIDLLWPTLLLIGVERVAIAPGITRVTPLDFQHYPISHSLMAAAGWAFVVGGVHFAIRGLWREAIVILLLVMSHWGLDAIVHRPDLPLTPFTDERIGLGLWNSLPGTLAVEFTILAIGVALYMRFTKARDAVGRWALWGLVAFLAIIQLGNVFGEPPPSVTAIAWVGHAQWLLVLWGFWVDKHRTSLSADEIDAAIDQSR
ncbi:hypothetical protein [Usitatibacter palustris]|uniref:Uncharacterized protein n=1 Tax=Usitatibacter palustris TaxID=2732487 RepID=A0A6M4H4U2_9PROT|nr:hypothetical protein [Usitatibacter palustris]QJR13723.1 hypothetical protein DSM104440_00513 [Usitatibacter palustris]